MVAQRRFRMRGGFGQGEEDDSVSWPTLVIGPSAVQDQIGRQLTCISFVDYAMYRVRLLRYHGITPFIVFDGGPLPAKKGTENSRAK